MKKFIVLMLSIVVLSCASVKTGFDYDKQADFSKYKTYRLSEETLSMPIQQLNRERIIAAVEKEMSAKSFTKSETSDIILDIRIKGEEVQTATATTSGGYGGYGRWGYGGGFSTTTVNYDKYVEGTLFITMVDNSTEKIVWQGTGTKTLDESASAQKREENINYAVQQIFKNYPPAR